MGCVIWRLGWGAAVTAIGIADESFLTASYGFEGVVGFLIGNEVVKSERKKMESELELNLLKEGLGKFVLVNVNFYLMLKIFVFDRRF